MTPRWLALALVLLFTHTLTAQQPGATTTSAPAPATSADILRMFEVMHTREEIQQVMEQAMRQMQAINREQLRKKRPDISEEDLDRMDKDSAEIMKNFPIAQMMQDMVPVYQKHLTRADVRALINFYSTPTGQKLLREMPALTAEAMQAVSPRIQQHLEEALRRLDRQVEEQKNRPANPPQDKD